MGINNMKITSEACPKDILFSTLLMCASVKDGFAIA